MNFNEAVKAYNAEPSRLHEYALAVVSELTLKEKRYILCGHAMKATVVNAITKLRYYNATPYCAGGIKRLGIPDVRFTDGPRGVVMGRSTCFPSAMCRGATFDAGIEYRVGEAIAREAIAGGANYFAGICINLLRHPKWGRAQETYGEDTCLLGAFGASLTKAVQDKGMIACPKHFALNSIEDLRFKVNAKADEVTLQEIYLPHFRKCVEAGALSIMGAYNRVNGTYSCESEYLLRTVLRGQWGFDGFASSDFMWGVYDAERSLKAGMDLEMPYTVKYKKINKYLKQGKLTMENVDEACADIIGVLMRTEPKLSSFSKEVIVCKEHTQLAKEVARKGITLLKNDGVLPIPNGKRVAIIGRYANKINTGDHGSSRVYSPYTVTPYQGFCSALGKQNVALYNGADVKRALATAKGCDYTVLTVGSDHTQEGEFLFNIGGTSKRKIGIGGDRRNLNLPPEDVRLIRALAKEVPNLIVSVIGGSAYVISEWEGDVRGIVMSYYNGMEGGNALAELLLGKQNFSGKLPFTMAKNEQDYPPFLHIGQGYEIEYGYFHGYALLDREGKRPLFPFGYGLSYTTFELSAAEVSVDKAAGALRVSVSVANTGDMDGAEVVQVYAGSADGKAQRAVKQLKGFLRIEVPAGQSKKAELSVPLDDLRFYNAERAEWEFDKEYNVFVGNSSAIEQPTVRISLGE